MQLPPLKVARRIEDASGATIELAEPDQSNQIGAVVTIRVAAGHDLAAIRYGETYVVSVDATDATAAR